MTGRRMVMGMPGSFYLASVQWDVFAPTAWDDDKGSEVIEVIEDATDKVLDAFKNLLKEKLGRATFEALEIVEVS
jgi:hypothetical protein